MQLEVCIYVETNNRIEYLWMDVGDDLHQNTICSLFYMYVSTFIIPSVFDVLNNAYCYKHNVIRPNFGPKGATGLLGIRFEEFFSNSLSDEN